MNYLKSGLTGLCGLALASMTVSAVSAEAAKRGAALLDVTALMTGMQETGAQDEGIDGPAKKARPVTYNCNTTKTIAKSSTKSIEAPVTTAEPVADTKIAFKTKAKGCVIVRFSADIGTLAPGHSLFAIAVLDGEAVLEPGVVTLTSATTDSTGFYRGVRSFEFLMKNVKAGKHAVELSWVVAEAADFLPTITARTTVVEY